MKSTVSAMLATLMLNSGLTSCATSPTTAAGKLSIYAPDVLRLPEGATVETIDGTHTAQQPEVWHSDRRFRTLERRFLQRFPTTPLP